VHINWLRWSVTGKWLIRMARKPPTDGAGGDGLTTYCPGAYRYVLEKVCAEDAARRGGSYLLADNAAAFAALDQERAEKKAELMRERSGKPVRCRSYQLPSRLSAPCEKFPRDGSRRFVVYPTGEIVLLPRESRTA
jgi:hypothetical protein